MVWFQCEDCGDNLKKPKLPNHFRSCSASKLSCIDCGQVFGRQTVESHTQCITEAEKYGPKGQGQATSGAKPKTKNDSNKKPDFDINVGLSERPPWFCSLCNTKATSKQTLQLHAEGKKHRAKARAFHAANQPKQTEETNNGSVENSGKDETLKGQEEEQNPSKPETNISETKIGDLQSSRKRKLEAAEKDGARGTADGNTCSELEIGEVIQVLKADDGKKNHQVKMAKKSEAEDCKVVDSCSDKDNKKEIKWKKLISSYLKSNPDGTLKLKKLRKLVLKSLKESGHLEDEDQITNVLDQKINSSSKFTVDGKYIRLAKKS